MMARARAELTTSVAGAIVTEFKKRGISCILLKGLSFANRLYENPDDRRYMDTDLLVPTDSVFDCEAILAEQGFEHQPLDDLEGDKPWHAHEWQRPSDRVSIDLHRFLIGTRVGPRELWETLSSHTRPLDLGEVTVDVLDDSALAFHVALHAAQHGRGWDRPQQDLQRALSLLDRQTWEKAAVLAESLNAVPAFSTGLRLSPQGRELAEELALAANISAEVILRAQSDVGIAIGLDWLSRTPGARSKLKLIRAKLFPPADFLKAWTPIARRGKTGLVIAYLWRPLWLCRQLPSGYSKWARARRATNQQKKFPVQEGIGGREAKHRHNER